MLQSNIYLSPRDTNYTPMQIKHLRYPPLPYLTLDTLVALPTPTLTRPHPCYRPR